MSNKAASNTKSEKAKGQEVRKPQIVAYYWDQDTKTKGAPVDMSKLLQLGVEHWVLNAELGEKDPDLIEIRNKRGYNYIDYVDSTKMPNLKQKLEDFLKEYL